jgi:AsmA protein
MDNPSQERQRLPSSVERPPSKGLLGASRIWGRLSRRLFIVGLVALVGFAGAVAAIASWLFSPAALVASVSDQIQEATGLYVAARGQPRLSLAPRPHVSIENVALADRNGALVIEMDELHGVPKILPFLAGRLELGSVALVRPRARLDLDHKPVDAPGAAIRAAAAPPASPEAQQADQFRLGIVNIMDGSLRITRNGADYSARNVTASLDWRRIGESALLTAAFDWRGERLQGVLWVARPGALLRGDQAVTTARLDGEGLRLEAQGVAQTGANARFVGRVAGSAASVRESLRLFDLATPLPGPFGDAQFSAQAKLGARDASLTDLRAFVDGNAYEGEITVRDEDGRANVRAALKSDFVALKPMLADAPPLLSPDGQWSRETLEPPDLSGADVDLRLSARHARLGRLTIDDAVFALTLRDGALDLSLLDAQAYHGRMKGRASFSPTSPSLAAHLTAQTFGVDAGGLFRDAFGRQAVSGELDLTLALDAAGESIAQMVRTLGGRATFTLRQGEIAGVDFERALRRLEKRPLSSAQDIRSGSSPLDHASATLLIENGVGALEDGAAQGPGFSLSYKGGANLSERSLSLKAVAREADSSGKPRDKGLQIAFDLDGAWDDLTLGPDPLAFIRRSGAAAPLLPGAAAGPTPESVR